MRTQPTGNQAAHARWGRGITPKLSFCQSQLPPAFFPLLVSRRSRRPGPAGRAPPAHSPVSVLTPGLPSANHPEPRPARRGLWPPAEAESLFSAISVLHARIPLQAVSSHTSALLIRKGPGSRPGLVDRRCQGRLLRFLLPTTRFSSAIKKDH